MTEQPRRPHGTPDTSAGSVTRRQFLVGTSALALAAAVPACTTTEQDSSEKPARMRRNGTLLVKNSHTLVTMDEQRREIRGGGIFVRGKSPLREVPGYVS